MNEPAARAEAALEPQPPTRREDLSSPTKTGVGSPCTRGSTARITVRATAAKDRTQAPSRHDKRAAEPAPISDFQPPNGLRQRRVKRRSR